MADKGVSAFRGKNLLQGKFSDIKRRLQSGRIPRGSVLIVEALDRISRSDVSTALHLILELVNDYGLRIITLQPEPREFRQGQIDMLALLMAVVYLAQATGESELKSVRSRDNWERRRHSAMSDGAVMTSMCPAWLEARNGKYVVNAEKAKTVREIFRLAKLGLGTIAIAKRFGTAGRKPIGRAEKWSSTYIRRIIGMRATYGVWEPHKIVDGVKLALPAVPDYYPPVVDKQTYDDANAAVAERRKRKVGGSTRKYVNLFQSLLYDAEGNAYTSWDTRGYRQYISRATLRGEKWQAIRASVFEYAFWQAFLTDNADRFLPPEVTSDSATLAELDAERRKLSSVRAKIDVVKQQVMDDSDTDSSFVDLLASLDTKRKQHQAKIELLERSSAVVSADRVKEWFAFMRNAIAGTLLNDQRLEVRNILRQLVKRIELSLTSDKGGYEISGHFVIYPLNGGEETVVDFTFHPFNGRRKLDLFTQLELWIDGRKLPGCR